MSEAEFGAYLDLLYGTAVEPADWEPTIARFADLIGGAKAWMPSLNLYSGGGQGVIARLEQTAQDSYFQYYYATNPFVPIGGATLTEPWPLNIATDEDLMSKAQFTALEYYNDFLLPQDIHSFVTIRLARRGGVQSTLNITRPPHKEQFGDSDLEIARRLHPHLIRAFNITRKLSAVRRENDELATVFERSTHGLFLLDTDGRVRRANDVGERLAGEPEGLRVADQRLTARNLTEARRLHALIATAGANDPGRRCGGSMALATPGRRSPLSITVAPIRGEHLAVGDTGPSILVCVTDLEAGVRLPEQKLRDLFGLTAAETRLALAMFEGLTQREAAERFSLSLNTVHVQLARVFEKTGVKRQAELMRLMMRAAGLEVG
ncbi:helix-turn-helix transcriptional regulator [Phenylobacterium sp.]|uniref:helix-turn-helix transcriptional regulator n=1 Tax=Phenylobacterium sp. TaxID=1871053 RepID=UPI001216D77B|nr:helix-turn-helix transcriptional regulator [Phenylobacterium sp.]THD64280.1 MAG: LuxR family transcriptional regulator [Phenylobacterium sp.]